MIEPERSVGLDLNTGGVGHGPTLMMRFILVMWLACIGGSAFASRADELVEEARELARGGDIGGAEGKLKSALESDRNNVDANVEMGSLKLMRNDLVTALQFANAALAKDRKNAGALILYVRINAFQGVPDVGLKKVEEVANGLPQDAGAQLAYTEALVAAKKYDLALLAVTRVLKLQETSVPAMKLLARTYLGLLRPVTAESILLRALDIERDAEALTLLAGIRYDEKNYIEARVLLEEAVEKDASYVEALNSLGALYVVVRSFEAANDTLQKALALSPSLAEAWLNLGSAQRGEGEFEKAEASWKRTLTLAPKMNDAWYNLGILYLENPLGKRDKIQQLTDAVNAFNAYKRGGGGLDPNADKFIEEARLLMKQEQDRRTEQLKGPQTKPEETKPE